MNDSNQQRKANMTTTQTETTRVAELLGRIEADAQVLARYERDLAKLREALDWLSTCETRWPMHTVEFMAAYAGAITDGCDHDQAVERGIAANHEAESLRRNEAMANLREALRGQVFGTPHRLDVCTCSRCEILRAAALAATGGQ